MRLRQEQTVFVLALLVLGAMTWGLLNPSVPSRGPSRGSGGAAEFTPYLAPPVELALPDDARPPLKRELFTPPRDTRVLPPLALVEPPRRPLAYLLPPTDPGPSPRAYGKLLRREVAFVEAGELFAEAEADEAAEVLGDLPVPGDEDSDVLARSAQDEPTVQELLAELAAAGENPFEDETPAERAARYAGYRQQYDWIQVAPGQYLFGRIENENRYGLATDVDRANEPLLFVEVDAATGIEKLKSVGAPAVSRPRDAMVDFGFAETVANELELERRRIPSPLTRGGFDQALALADRALRDRHEAPQALAMAEELYRLAADYDRKDFVPRLGLARVFEAGFRFEEAFAEYRRVIDEFPGRAEPHVRLGLLEERFLLLDEAEARLRRALTTDSGNWVARSALGGFLARRGRHVEAVPHLEAAVRFAPSEPQLLYVRVENRVALADALIALGDPAAAREVYAQAAVADPNHQRALAGLRACELFLADELVSGGSAAASGTGGVDDPELPGEPLEPLEEGAGFELLLVRGLEATLARRFDEARDLLVLAEAADPLRASSALSALAFLALVTGNDADATTFVEQAIERDPSNAYALYLLGRMLGLQDDYEGARGALIAALEVEVDFEDALVALGDMAFQLGRFEDAARYLERALEIDATRAEVFALQGLVQLQLGSVGEARGAFRAALDLDPAEPTAKAGNAWCAYLDDDVTEGLKLLADLDDARRDRPEEDPWRVWARAQISRVQDHVEKVEWTDNFNRTRLINGWLTRQSDGPTVGMKDGAVKIEGQFDRLDGEAKVYREYIASEFVSFSANVRVSSRTAGRAGVFVARERQRRGESDVIGEASVSRHEDGSLQVRFVRQGQPEETLDMQQTFPLDQWVRLSIEREGISSDTTVTISLDGVPLVEDVSLPSLGGANSPILVGLFAEGDAGREVLVEMDEASVVYRGNR